MKAFVERVARALCHYTGKRQFKGKNLDAYVEIHWRDHAECAGIAIQAINDHIETRE